MFFERILKSMCWPWGFVCRLRYDYENFPHPGDDPKRVCIVMQNQKNFWWKKSFHRNFWPKFDIFQRSLKKSQTIVLPFTCLLLIEIRIRKIFTVFRWCKTCAHWIIEHEKILLKKKFSSKFLTQIWHFPQSQYEKSSLRANFECQKKMLRHFCKNPRPQFCRSWSGEQIKYPQNGHISWIERYKN